MLRFIGERHPGHLLLVAEAWAAAIGDVSSFDEEAWDTFSAALVDAIDERSTVESALLVDGEDDPEVILVVLQRSTRTAPKPDVIDVPLHEAIGAVHVRDRSAA